MEKTLTKEYFTIIGELQKRSEGLRIMDDANIWSLYYSLIELRGREDILKIIMKTGYFEYDGHMRIIFSKLLTGGYKEMRAFATNYCSTLLEQNPETFHEWMPMLLLPQVLCCNLAI